MSEFRDKFNGCLDKTTHNAKLALTAFSTNPDEAGPFNPEAAAMSMMLKSAIDNNEPEARFLSKPARLSEQMSEFTIAAIGLNRNDISDVGVKPNKKRDKCLEMTTKGDLCFSRMNPHREPAFDKEQWAAERLRLLKISFARGARIVSLGEFDYPPALSGRDGAAFEEKFVGDVQQIVDECTDPAFVVMGTRHDYNKKKKTCSNRARIFVNRKIFDRAKPQATGNKPLKHEKQISATKAGERISRPKVSNLRFYTTKYGNIGVLICVDAYNPTVLFSLLNAKMESNLPAPDIVLVPAYNTSDKLYYACQILSLMCGCYVVLIDACSESSRPESPKPAVTELFVAGQSFGNLHRQDVSVGKVVETGEPSISAWEISVDYLNTVRRAVSSKHTPFFNEVSQYVNQTSLRT